jgi:glycosyltransferase involved in cell wall biosynthesis
LPLPRLNRNPLFFAHWLWAGARLAYLVRTVRAELLHTFTARTHLIGTVAARISGVPLVWRLGDDTLPPRLLTLLGRFPRCIVGVSRWITTRYPQLRFDGLVPDGAPPPPAITRAAARAELGLPPDRLVVAHVGRLVRWKGQAVLLRALAQVRVHLPAAYGLIVGNWSAGDDAPGPLGGGATYAQELHRLAADLNLTEHITFAGFVRDPNLAYAAADVVTHTSTLPEPFGRVVIEAMMLGRPVVAAAAGALPEIITDGQTGHLTPPGDAAALAERLGRLLASPDERARIGVAARERAEAEFSLATMIRNMQAAYELALSRR